MKRAYSLIKESKEKDAHIKKTPLIKQNFQTETQGLPSISSRCTSCKQKIDTVIYYSYNGHPNNSNEEFISLTNETLLIFTGQEEDLVERDTRPIHKLTGYNIYDDQGHLTPFDTGLIEDNTILRLSGYIKPIYTEDESIDGGIPTHDIGPINAWYISGFDGGERAYVGIITAYAEYILMEPSPDYLIVVAPFLKKIPLVKVILEFLMDFGWENPNYEDLLFHLQTCGTLDFDEEFLLENAHFICKQVFNFEEAAPDEDPLMSVPCMKTLVELSGVVLKKSKNRMAKRNLRVCVERKATTTKLVRAIFENFFPQQMDEKDGKMLKKKRCGICDSCQTPDCGKCSHCRDMVKFGGSGKSKQACKLRRCPNMDLAEDSDDLDEEEGKNAQNIQTKKCSSRQITNKIEWLDEPYRIEGEKKFYKRVLVGNNVVSPGDFVLLNPDVPTKPLIIGKVISIFSKHSQPTFHANFFYRGIDTMLGETANTQELFLVDICEDCTLGSIVAKTQVTFKKIPDNWSQLGGIQTLVSSVDDNTFFFTKRYDPETARFTDYVEEVSESEECLCCRRRSEYRQFDSRILEGNLIRWRGQQYSIGSGIFLNPTVYRFSSRPVNKQENVVELQVDEEKYPERYRKNLDNVSNDDMTEPFCVGQIEDLYCTKKSGEIKIKVRIFYRPENTKNSVFLAHEKDLNLLYWTDEVIVTSFNNVIGPCYLTYCDPSEAQEWSDKGPSRFYFTEGYNPKTYEFFDVPKHASNIGYFKKAKGKAKTKPEPPKADTPPEWEEIGAPLKCMDVFAGCGGLSLGLHQSGVAETKWAIEIMSKPAEAFKVNIHNCRVFVEDCNKILKDILSEKSKNLPKKGDVEMLVGGPPCQGFSNMNRFSARQYSLLKNSLIVTLLSFCDYYRPKIFVLENVRHFASFKRAMVLKLTVRGLLEMGYQVTFGILQAAHYGLPQTRRRFILIAVAPGVVLPRMPPPQHVFEKKDYHLSVSIDGIKYYKDNFWEDSAPYRTICVRDAISDLPIVSNGHSNDKIPYDDEPISHFQRKVRGNNTILYDHICKDMAPIVEARIMYIPCIPGSDWRDLPNICVKLRDNTMTNKLEYPYYSKKQTKFEKPRAICQCGTGKSCNPLDRQLNTLIPWCLPHTADRHNNWAGLYGRLGWDEVFRTTMTNPEPIGKQGKVIHPEQHRVVSVRECARSQGFPDQFRFFGNILDKHRQIGNAVPPPLAKAIGFELRKAIALTEKKKLNS